LPPRISSPGLPLEGGSDAGEASRYVQIGVSFNCDNRTFCVDPTTGQPSLGGFWGWLELDNAA
jgi:hypothetical protein